MFEFGTKMRYRSCGRSTAWCQRRGPASPTRDSGTFPVPDALTQNYLQPFRGHGTQTTGSAETWVVGDRLNCTMLSVALGNRNNKYIETFILNSNNTYSTYKQGMSDSFTNTMGPSLFFFYTREIFFHICVIHKRSALTTNLYQI